MLKGGGGKRRTTSLDWPLANHCLFVAGGNGDHVTRAKYEGRRGGNKGEKEHLY